MFGKVNKWYLETSLRCQIYNKSDPQNQGSKSPLNHIDFNAIRHIYYTTMQNCLYLKHFLGQKFNGNFIKTWKNLDIYTYVYYIFFKQCFSIEATEFLKERDANESDSTF